jgi:peptidyl-prolyl cis-trans isomerase D
MKKAKSNTIEIKEQTKKTKKSSLKQIGVLIIVLLISLSLIPWVISNDLFSNTSQDDKWVKVGNKYTVSNIILGEYSSFLEKNYYYIQQNPYMLMQFLNNLISQYVNILLFANEAENINLSVDKNLLLNLISEIPVFKNPDGTFNSDEFKKRVTLIFGSEEIFMSNITDNILKDQLLEPIFPLISEPFFVAYIDLLALSQERTIRYIDVNAQISKASLPKPTDANLEKLRDENKAIFTSLESRDGEYLTIDITSLIEKVTVSDNEIKDYYEKTKGSYLTNENRTISQISFDTKEQAEKAYKDLKDGKKLEKEFASIENIEYTSLPEDFSKAIFNAKLNDLNKPVESPVGWHVFKVIKINPQATKSLNDVKKLVKEEILVSKKSLILDAKRSEISNLANQNLSLKEIAQKTGSIYHAFSNLNEENVYDKKISEDLFKQISTLEINKKSDVIDDTNGHLFIVHLSKINPATLKPINEIKPVLLELWENNKIEEKSTELESKLISEIIKGKKISALGYKIKTFSGNMTDKKIPFSPESTDVLFTTEKNMPISGVLKTKGKIVAIVENIKNKDIQYDKNGVRSQEVVNFANYVSEGYTQSYFERYASVLAKKYKITVNQEAIMNKLAPTNQEAQ